MASKKGFKCPNCGSEFCSSIIFWKESKDFHTLDAYKCHDCEQLTDPATDERLPEDFQPKRKPTAKGSGQVDLFGKIKNVADVIDPVPKLVESPTGFSVLVSKAPAGSTQQYKDELGKMVRELGGKKIKRDRPHWYRYRKFKRKV